MKERPILFSGPMVRAILEGRKTQTRRVVAKQPETVDREPKYEKNTWGFWNGEWPSHGRVVRCPYGVPGDRLWVRETWGVGSRPYPWGGYDGIEYRADEGFIDPNEKYPTLECVPVKTPDDVSLGDYRSGWHPSIHMPRWASRITLEITDVRVQRVQEISEEDAQAEGIELIQHSEGPNYFSHQHGDGWHNAPTAVECFADLWESINGKTHPWVANPWVWALTFRRVA